MGPAGRHYVIGPDNGIVWPPPKSLTSVLSPLYAHLSSGLLRLLLRVHIVVDHTHHKSGFGETLSR